MPRTDQHVRDYLSEAIGQGLYPPGTRLPTERALCETLAVSRSTVRNALGLLEGEGRIVRVPGSGTYVSEGAGAGLAKGDVLRVTSPAQVMEARLIMEPPIAHLVVANGSGADFERLEECVREGGAATTLEGFEHWDAALHAAIADAAHNPLVSEAYRLISRARERGEWGELKRRSLTPERRAHYQDEHERIVGALRRRDAEAGEREIRAHLLRVRANLLGI